MARVVSNSNLPTETNDATQPTSKNKRNPAEADTASADGTRPVQSDLQNWQVVEIEGEATHLPTDDPRSRYTPYTQDDDDDPDPGVDQVDSILIAGLPERQVMVKPGSGSQLVVSLLNNGSAPCDFDVHIEGWVRDGWLAEGKKRITMQSGERNAATFIFAPPRDASALAGEFPLVVVLRSPQYARRVTRLHAKLIIQPYTDFTLGKLETPQGMRARPRQGLFVLPVSNLSNHPIAMQLQAQTMTLDSEAEWMDPKTALQHTAPATRGKRERDGWLVNPTVVTLATGESREIGLRVTPRKGPIFGGQPTHVPVRVTASVVGEVRMPRSASGEMQWAPPVKPWHLGLAAAASVMVLIFSAAAALGATLLFGGRMGLASASSPIVIVLNQNAPVSSVQSVAQGYVPPENTAADTSAESAGALVVTADQVTSPGGSSASASVPQSATQPQTLSLGSAPAAAAPAGAAPMVNAADVSAPGTGGAFPTQTQTAAAQVPAAVHPAQNSASAGSQPVAALTYGEMFQEIALQYDLDWRLLAAQAYVETGLDALALGNDGDMGLMQVLPNTWREWAPTVGAVDPFDAYSNTLVASAYLDYVRGELGKRGFPQAQWMLVGYNWGPDRLVNFLDGGGTWEELPAVRSQYASDILKIARTIP